jgi:hypothetical protein
MKKYLWRTAVLLLCAASAARIARADEPKKAAPSADEKAMMEAWMKYSTPGDVHKRMAAMEGRWTAHVKEWMAPNAPATESDGTAEFKMVLGGRYLHQSFHGTMMGQPYEGMGLSGYDNAKKTTQSVWVDNAGTGIMMMTGNWDADGKSLAESGSMDDPMTGKKVQMKSEMHMADADHSSYTMWMSGPDGKMFKCMEIAYSRKK